MSKLDHQDFRLLLKHERYKYRALGMIILPFLLLWIAAENRRYLPRTLLTAGFFAAATWILIHFLGRTEVDSLLGVVSGYLFCGAAVGDIKFKADYTSEAAKRN